MKLLSPNALLLGFALVVAIAGGPTVFAAPASQPLTLTRGSRLMIDAHVNGRAVQALLDSAAEVTILDRQFARSLKLAGGQAVSGQGSGQGSFEASMVDGVLIEARRIAVVASGQEPAGVRLALVTEHGVETIPVQVEGSAPVRATFDLGNGSHVLLGKSYAERLGLTSDGRTARTERGGGLGGETTRQVYTLRAITIAGRMFTNVQAAIDPQPSA